VADQQQSAHRSSMCDKVLLVAASSTLANVKICETYTANLDLTGARIKEIEAKALRKLCGPNPFNAA
jgi:hypothetical protein